MADRIEQRGGDQRHAAGPETVGEHEAAPVAQGPITDQPGAGAAADEPPAHAGAGRRRGLEAWFAPGGEDEATDARRADERRNLRLLLAMVAALVLIPTLLTIVGLAQEIIARRGG